MPITMSRAVAECLRQAARWLEGEAALLQSGEVVRIRDGRDESKTYAEELIHRARNMETSVEAFERRLDREELSAGKGTILKSTGSPALGAPEVKVMSVSNEDRLR